MEILKQNFRHQPALLLLLLLRLWLLLCPNLLFVLSLFRAPVQHPQVLANWPPTAWEGETLTRDRTGLALVTVAPIYVSFPVAPLSRPPQARVCELAGHLKDERMLQLCSPQCSPLPLFFPFLTKLRTSTSTYHHQILNPLSSHSPNLLTSPLFWLQHCLHECECYTHTHKNVITGVKKINRKQLTL